MTVLHKSDALRQSENMKCDPWRPQSVSTDRHHFRSNIGDEIAYTSYVIIKSLTPVIPDYFFWAVTGSILKYMYLK